MPAVIGSVTTYRGLTLSQGAMTYSVTPTAGAPIADDQAQPLRKDAEAAADREQAACVLAAGAVNLAPAAMSALIQAQASLSKTAPAMIRRHTAETLGQMIWNLDQAPPLSPAPLAVRELQAARAALTQSLVDLQA